ncbi:hypothetical protein ACIBL3_08010 [Kribbella sp. NPDC050124]|uniref:hypothetical protein n=1 Tax=Kribbella sp. NPDC050124 TaxID=3364114 RepID=UPI00378B9514
MQLPAGVTVADLIRAGYDIGHGHGSRSTVLATPDKAKLVALGKKMGALTGYPVSTGDGGVGYLAPGATVRVADVLADSETSVGLRGAGRGGAVREAAVITVR